MTNNCTSSHSTIHGHCRLCHRCPGHSVILCPHDESFFLNYLNTRHNCKDYFRCSCRSIYGHFCLRCGRRHRRRLSLQRAPAAVSRSGTVPDGLHSIRWKLCMRRWCNFKCYVEESSGLPWLRGCAPQPYILETYPVC